MVFGREVRSLGCKKIAMLWETVGINIFALKKFFGVWMSIESNSFLCLDLGKSGICG